jgi:hypothetical protein
MQCKTLLLDHFHEGRVGQMSQAFIRILLDRVSLAAVAGVPLCGWLKRVGWLKCQKLVSAREVSVTSMHSLET